MSKLGYPEAPQETPSIPPLLLTPIQGYGSISNYIKSIVVKLKDDLRRDYYDIHYSLLIDKEKETINIIFYGVKKRWLGLDYLHYKLCNLTISDKVSKVFISDFGYAYTWKQIARYTPSYLNKYAVEHNSDSNKPYYSFRTPFWRKYD